MKTISAHDLEHVTGGKAPTTSAGSSDSNDQLLTTLQNIQSSLKDLNKSSNGLFGGNNGLLFMTMALAMSRRSEVVAYGNGCRRGFCFRSW